MTTVQLCQSLIHILERQPSPPAKYVLDRPYGAIYYVCERCFHEIVATEAANAIHGRDDDSRSN